MYFGYRGDVFELVLLHMTQKNFDGDESHSSLRYMCVYDQALSKCFYKKKTSSYSQAGFKASKDENNLSVYCKMACFNLPNFIVVIGEIK